jgi:nucleoside-diphosphate-sugar epimerase
VTAPPSGATVFGAAGFVGSRLVRHLHARGLRVRAIGRGDTDWQGQDLGHVFYCIGLTADFRSRPLDAVDAHVSRLVDVLRKARFDSFLYLSSTRVYGGASSAAEDARLSVDPSDPSDLYNLSKLTGEATCLSAGRMLGRAEVRVARLSNVFGADFRSENFLSSILRDAVERRSVTLGTSLESTKDYVWVDDVVHALERIACDGTSSIYNVAAGLNTTHREIVAALQAATGCAISVAPEAPTTTFPVIAIERLRGLTPRPFRPVTDAIPELTRALQGSAGGRALGKT